MDKVANAEMKVIELVEKAQEVMNKRLDEWMTEDEKALVSEAREIEVKVGDAIRKAQDEANAISVAEGVQWPAPYQALVDELAPLREREHTANRFRRAIGNLSNNPYSPSYHQRHIGHPWKKVMAPTLAEEVFEAWQTGGRNTSFTRINLIRYQMDNKTRSGSKANQARDAWNRLYEQRRTDAARTAEVEIHAANLSWATILKMERKLYTTLDARKTDDLALFKKPIEDALKNLQTELSKEANKTGGQR